PPAPLPAVPICMAVGRIDIRTTKLERNWGVARVESRDYAATRILIHLLTKVANAVVQLTIQHKQRGDATSTVIDDQIATEGWLDMLGLCMQRSGFSHFAVFGTPPEEKSQS